MEYVKDRELFSNPYIIQMDRFAESLKHLSEKFLYLEDYKGSITRLPLCLSQSSATFLT